MSVAATNLIQSGSAVDATSYTPAGFTTAPGRSLILVSFVSRTGITADPNLPTITGSTLVYDLIGSVVFDNTSSSRRRLTLWRGVSSSSVLEGFTFDCGGQTQTSGDWVVDYLTGCDTSGVHGQSGIAQSGSNSDPSGTGTSLTVTLGAFASSANATYGAFGYGFPPNAATAGSGFAKVGEFQEGEGGSLVTTEFKNTNDTTVDMSYAAGGEIGGIALEVRVDPAEAVMLDLAPTSLYDIRQIWTRKVAAY